MMETKREEKQIDYRVYRLSRTLSGLGGPKISFIRTLHLFLLSLFPRKNDRVQ